MPNIDTGFEESFWSNVKSVYNYRCVLFGPESPTDQLYSDRIDVKPGKVILAQAFGMLPDRKVFLRTVSPGPSPAYPSHHANSMADLYIAPMTLGNPDDWTLDETHTQMLIALPGLYRFELEDSDMLTETFRLEYYAWDGAPLLIPVLR